MKTEFKNVDHAYETIRDIVLRVKLNQKEVDALGYIIAKAKLHEVLQRNLSVIEQGGRL